VVRVTVIGDALLDVRATPSGPMRPGADVPASVDVGPGGQGANVAVRLARRGVPTRLVCRLGPDAAGELLRRSLASDGVELLDLGAQRTGAVIVLVDGAGERTMLSQRVPLLAPGPPPKDILETDWLIVSGYVLLERSAGISASGSSPRRAIAGCALGAGDAEAWVDAARSLQPHLVVVNVEEARALVGDSSDRAGLARRLAERLSAIAVVTEASGATGVIGDTLVAATAAGAPAALDTTGAGDAFLAAMVAGLSAAAWPPSGDALAAAMGAAAELAAAVTRVAGAQGRVPGEGEA
jgi:sugar/nucleoside kinase (ribokinase family)